MRRSSKLFNYIKNYRRGSLFFRNLLLLVLIINVPLTAVGSIFYRQSLQSIEKEINSMSLSSLCGVRDVWEAVFNEMTLLATQISLQKDVKKFLLVSDNFEEYSYPGDTEAFLQGVSSGGGSGAGLLNTMDERIKLFTYIYNYVDSIYIHSTLNGYMYSNLQKAPFGKFPDKDWYDFQGKSESQAAKVIYRKKRDSYPHLISVVKPVYIEENMQVGTVVVNVGTQELGTVIKDPRLQKMIFILDENGTVVYADHARMIGRSAAETDYLRDALAAREETSGRVEVEGDSRILSVALSENYKWKYVSLTPASYFDSKNYAGASFIFSIMLLGLLLGLVGSVIASLKTYKPLSSIMSYLETAGGASAKNGNEVQFILASIQKTFAENQELGQELASRLELLNKAQVGALQAQINPHFLYNTLESIKWMVVDPGIDKEEVSTVLSYLGDLFRVSFDWENYFISIREELAYVDKYIRLLQVRYQDKFQVEWRIEDKILDCRTVKLCLQPLVENAVYHGIKPKRRSGTLVIDAFGQGEHVILRISDDGVGMAPEAAARLNERLEHDNILSSQHIGISNVNQRIKLIFGGNYGIRVESRLQEGTCVTVKVPLLKN